MDCFTDLTRRGLIFDSTHPEDVSKLLNGPPIRVYCGFDPTNSSLHVGNMVPLLNLARLQRYGHRPVVLAGGATGLVGDPSGKSKERNLLDKAALQHNTECVKRQLSSFVDFEGDNAAILVDNADWIGPMTFLEFLRDVGKHFGIGTMLGKESVRQRLETGLSYTEFSYMLLQAYDFLHLYREYDCVMQIGGSDQWGNITAGTDLIRKVARGQGYGMVNPLITDNNGQKLGKSTDGAVFLDPEKTSPYAMFQYFMGVGDADVVAFLRYLTFLTHEEIDALAAETEAHPHKRQAQRRLAQSFTSLIHGDAAARSAEVAGKVLFGGSVDELSEPDLLAVASDVPTTDTAEAFGVGRPLLDLFTASGLCKSRGEAKRLLGQGGVYVNNERMTCDADVPAEHLLFGRHLLLRAGKKKYHLLSYA